MSVARNSFSGFPHRALNIHLTRSPVGGSSSLEHSVLPWLAYPESEETSDDWTLDDYPVPRAVTEIVTFVRAPVKRYLRRRRWQTTWSESKEQPAGRPALESPCASTDFHFLEYHGNEDVRNGRAMRASRSPLQHDMHQITHGWMSAFECQPSCTRIRSLARVMATNRSSSLQWPCGKRKPPDLVPRPPVFYALSSWSRFGLALELTEEGLAAEAFIRSEWGH